MFKGRVEPNLEKGKTLMQFEFRPPSPGIKMKPPPWLEELCTLPDLVKSLAKAFRAQSSENLAQGE